MQTLTILAMHPINLLKALDTYFEGSDWYSWEPEVVLTELKDEVSDQAADKVLAVKSLAANTEMAFYNHSAFENIVHAFCNNMLVVDTNQPMYVEEIMYAVPQIIQIARYVHGDLVDVEFRGEVPGYIAATAKYRGWVVLPKRLQFAQEILDSLTGIEEGSKRYTEFKTTIALVKNLVEAMDATDVTQYTEMLGFLEEDTEKSLIAKRILGSYLYDPTKSYGVKSS